MANKYSKANFVNKDEENKPKNTTNNTGEMREYEKKRKRLNTGAKIMAILVALAMIVTAFLSSGVFFIN